jgi:hypothetical protein
MLRFIGAAIGVSLLGTLLGCSSSSGGGSCTSSYTCGGNIAGTWNVTQACETLSNVMASSGVCAAETAQAGSVTITGTAAFNSDMSYTLALNESISETLNIPSSCLTMSGATITCAELSEAIASVGGSDAGGPAFTCTTAGSGCSCNVVESQAINETGTYTTSGNTLTTTASGGGGGGTSNYCVSGNSLHVLTENTGADGGMTTGTEFVATK